MYLDKFCERISKDLEIAKALLHPFHLPEHSPRSASTVSFLPPTTLLPWRCSNRIHFLGCALKLLGRAGLAALDVPWRHLLSLHAILIRYSAQAFLA